MIEAIKDKLYEQLLSAWREKSAKEKPKTDILLSRSIELGQKIRLFPDFDEKTGITKDGYRIFYVKFGDLIRMGHWLTEEELKKKRSDFEDPMFFIG